MGGMGGGGGGGADIMSSLSLSLLECLVSEVVYRVGCFIFPRASMSSEQTGLGTACQPHRHSYSPHHFAATITNTDSMPAGCLPVRAQPRSACRLGGLILRQPTKRRVCVSTSILTTHSTRPQFTHDFKHGPRTAFQGIRTSPRKAPTSETNLDKSAPPADKIAEVKEKLADILAKIQAIYKSDKVENEAVILRVLVGLRDVAKQAIAIRARQPLPAKATIRQSSAGAILSGLGDDTKAAEQKTAASRPLGFDSLPSPAYLSKVAEDFIRFATVYLSSDVLTVYVQLQRLLARPRTIPEAFYLYANKPVPIQDSSPPKFSKANPKSAKQAIPEELADDALTAAIETKDMPLAMCVVDQAYCAPAWRRRRIIQKFGIPAFIYSLVPFGIYTLAQEASVYSNFLHPESFKWYVAVGFTTYVGCTSMIGYIALTTYNDNHDRVVWLPGTPLTERYLREDERAAMDRIACSWGFKELWRRGEEDGEEWEGLRQVIARKSMVLDKPDLMPGMNPSPHPRELDP